MTPSGAASAATVIPLPFVPMKWIDVDVSDFSVRRQSKVKKAIRIANEVLSNPAFWSRVKPLPVFKLSRDRTVGVDGMELHGFFHRYLQRGVPARVEDYDPGRWSSAKARVTSDRPNLIQLSVRKLYQAVRSLIRTIVHELCHVVDHFIAEAYFGHGSNSSKGKDLTAPYYLGNIVFAFVRDFYPAELLGDPAPKPIKGVGVVSITGNRYLDHVVWGVEHAASYVHDKFIGALAWAGSW